MIGTFLVMCEVSQLTQMVNSRTAHYRDAQRSSEAGPNSRPRGSENNKALKRDRLLGLRLREGFEGLASPGPACVEDLFNTVVAIMLWREGRCRNACT